MRKLFGIAACAVCLSICTAVCADSITYDAEKSLVTFSVEDTGRATAYADKLSGQYFYAKEIDSVNGVITDNFRVPENVSSGKYVVSVVSASGETELEFYHMNTTSATPAVNTINAETTATGIKAAISANIAALGIDATDFATYGDAVSGYLAAADNSTDAADFWKDYHTALLLAKTTGATEAVIDMLLSTEGELIGFDYTAFSGYSVNVQNQVYSKLTAGSLTEKNLSDVLDIWTGLARLNDEESTTEYEKLLITDYGAVLGIDTSKFTAATKKTEIIKDIMAPIGGYSTSVAIVAAYDTAITNNPNGSGTGGGGGGGGGSSSSSSSKDEVPTVAVPNNPELINPDTNKEKVFSDVDNTHWARDIIAELKEKGIVSGTDGKFNPNNSISRAEFSTMIVQCFFKGEAASGAVQFADVNAGDWYYPYTTLLAEKGIVNGVGDGKFSPKSMITREDMAVIAMRCLSSKISVNETDNLVFNDVSRIADYAQTAVATLVSENILSGTPEGMFYPKNNLTRAEAAVVIYKLLERLEA